MISSGAKSTPSKICTSQSASSHQRTALADRMTSRISEVPMLRYLWDPANAITAAGLVFSSASLFLALSGDLELSVAVALWAVLADHLDGIVATRTPNRDPGVAKMGKSLDGFADIIYGTVLPSAIVIQLSHASILSLATA
ncbi:CDP-alcohol phosphatidyltransferase family protein, partial [Bradyrhizobium pachyrhizi]|uniref:CDP-alcohol phosphatidyltransferase family protein n=1 Tax=Bradyrhizobium pachyrhizi TaxID=280333 RepID=UPI0032DF7D81